MKHIILFLTIFLHFDLASFAQIDSIKAKGELGLSGQWQTGTLNQFVMNPETIH